MKVWLVYRRESEGPSWQILNIFATKELAKEYLDQFKDEYKGYHEYGIVEYPVLEHIPLVRWRPRWQDYKDIESGKYLFEL